MIKLFFYSIQENWDIFLSISVLLVNIWHELKKRDLPKSKWFIIAFCNFLKLHKKGQISILSLNNIKVNLIVLNNTVNDRCNDELNVRQNSYNFIHWLLSYSEWSILPPDPSCPVLPYLWFTYFIKRRPFVFIKRIYLSKLHNKVFREHKSLNARYFLDKTHVQ